MLPAVGSPAIREDPPGGFRQGRASIADGQRDQFVPELPEGIALGVLDVGAGLPGGLDPRDEGVEAVKVLGGEGIGGPEDRNRHDPAGGDLDRGDQLLADAEGGVEASVKIGLFEVRARVVETQGPMGGAV